VRSPARAALYARLSGALSRAVEARGVSEIAEALAAPSDYASLLRVLSDPAAIAELGRRPPEEATGETRPDIRSDAVIGEPGTDGPEVWQWKATPHSGSKYYLRTAYFRLFSNLEDRARVLEVEGGAVSASEAVRLLGVSRQAVDKRRRAGQLVSLSTGKRGYRYPVWQFDASGERGILEGLEEVLLRLQPLDQWHCASFFLEARDELGGESPLALLRRAAAGDLEKVLAAAEDEALRSAVDR
jgi:hypothetical protein